MPEVLDPLAALGLHIPSYHVATVLVSHRRARRGIADIFRKHAERGRRLPAKIQQPKIGPEKDNGCFMVSVSGFVKNSVETVFLSPSLA